MSIPKLCSNKVVDIPPQGLRSTRKFDRRVISNPRWFDEFAKLRGKRLQYTLLVVVSNQNITHQYTSNKGFAEDLTEGKFSFPVVHGILANKSNRQIMSQFPHFPYPSLGLNSYSICNNFRRPPEAPYNTHTQDTYNWLSQERDQVIYIHFIRVDKPRGSN